MDKHRILDEIHEQLIRARFLGCKTDEGRLMLAIVVQGISDAMGLHNSDTEKVYIEHEGNARGKRKFITRQEEANQWFKDNGHYPFCDLINLEASWVTHLLRTKAGVEI